MLKVAVTDVLAFTVSIQTPVPVQTPPLQPVKTESADGVAVRVTIVPSLKNSEQSLPQLIPAGLLITVPLPLPALIIVSKAPLTVSGAAVTLLLSLLSVTAAKASASTKMK
jgi:hypothetical protein